MSVEYFSSRVRRTIGAVAILAAATIFYPLTAQAVALNISSLPNSQTQLPGLAKLQIGGTIGQTFVAPGNGYIDTIWFSTNGGNFEISFYEGRVVRDNLGKLIHTQTGFVTNNDRLGAVPLARHVAITRGTPYTFVIKNVSDSQLGMRSIWVTTEDTYNGGERILHWGHVRGGISSDVGFILTGQVDGISQVNAAPKVTPPTRLTGSVPPTTNSFAGYSPPPAIKPYEAVAGGPLTLKNCTPGTIQVKTFNANDRMMWVPYKTYNISEGQTSQMACATATCKVVIGGRKWENVTSYQVYRARDDMRATNPDAIKGDCSIFRAVR